MVDAKWIAYAKQYKISRMNLLVMIGLTVLNVILLFTNASFYFPFSAVLPQVAINVGFSSGLAIWTLLGLSLLVIFILCFFLSRKIFAFMIVALVFFSIDCAFSLWIIITEFNSYMIIDILFHFIVELYLILGVYNGYKLCKFVPGGVSVDDKQLSRMWQEYNFSLIHAQENQSPPFSMSQDGQAIISEVADSPIIRPQSSKGKILMMSSFKGMNILVKRCYGCTELIIDGNVYGERKGFVEKSYQIDATKGNTYFSVVMESTLMKAEMYLYANQILLDQKSRIV